MVGAGVVIVVVVVEVVVVVVGVVVVVVGVGTILRIHCSFKQQYLQSAFGGSVTRLLHETKL